jgi:Na+-transporting NADH:ubiquinone oxidoreductase subunit F
MQSLFCFVHGSWSLASSMARTVDNIYQNLQLKDYSLVGEYTQKAIEEGLAEAVWYCTPVPKAKMRELHERKDLPALRDCLIYFGAILLFGYATFALWGTWWALIPMLCYGVLYASASDARWHESSHGTAFRTDWLNTVLYEVSSFMVLRESVPWRWSHTRHHSDTIIVGRDPEIAVPRPPSLTAMLLKCINFQAFRRYLVNILTHCKGRVTKEEATFIPESEWGKVFFRARVYALIYVLMIAACVHYQTWLPFVFVLGPNLYGAWLMPIYGWTQHAGLAEDVLDHRLNCRTIHMNFVHRFLYWNMNYHLEHHMFPLVPYHQLPKLHELIKDDCPKPYKSLFDAYREIVPTVLRQIKDPGYFVRRELPDTAHLVNEGVGGEAVISGKVTDDAGWVEVGDADLLGNEDVLRFDHDARTFAIYKVASGELYASDGICTHGSTHLADGLVKGKLVECPKHNGRFNVTDGSPARPPVCVALQTYAVEEREGKIFLNIRAKGERAEKEYPLRVVGNRYVSTFIKELTLEPVGKDFPKYQPGQYMQINIPAYDEISFAGFDVAEPYATSWRAHHVFDNKSGNIAKCRRNYSLATNPDPAEKQLKFNIRIATPPKGLRADAGVGSTYMHSLQEGDEVTAVGPYGDFLIKQTDREMVYLGGGAGMAPMRSHLSHLFETLKTRRRVSFWYGVRSRQEIFYEDYFRSLEEKHENFSFHIALSEPLESDAWDGATGFIHDVLRREYLEKHQDPALIEYYLCGPPPMVRAGDEMLKEEFKVPGQQIAYDEF